jgi:hypothetical protein
MDDALYEGQPVGSTVTKPVRLADGKEYPHEFKHLDSETWNRYRSRLFIAMNTADPDQRGSLTLDAQAYVVSESIAGVNGKTGTISFEKARKIHTTILDRFIKAINEVRELPDIDAAGKG